MTRDELTEAKRLATEYVNFSLTQKAELFPKLLAAYEVQQAENERLKTAAGALVHTLKMKPVSDIYCLGCGHGVLIGHAKDCTLTALKALLAPPPEEAQR